MVTHCNVMGSTDGLTFEAFVSQKLVDKLWQICFPYDTVLQISN